MMDAGQMDTTNATTTLSGLCQGLRNDLAQLNRAWLAAWVSGGENEAATKAEIEAEIEARKERHQKDIAAWTQDGWEQQQHLEGVE